MYKNMENVFLATTAKEEFWDISKQIIFLGDWCRRYSRKSCWELLPDKVIDGPLSSSEKLAEAYSYVKNIYEHILPQLAEALNSIHRRKYSQRYWRILIGTWLFDYISIIYDRYLLIDLVLERYPGFSTILLAKDSFVTANDTSDFISHVLDDAYNLQVFTRIIDRLLPNDFMRKNLKIVTTKPNTHFTQQFKDLVKILLRKDSMRSIRKDTKIILKNAYFPRNIEQEMDSKIRSQIAIINNSLPSAGSFALNNQAREGLKGLTGIDDPFLALLTDLLPLDIPQCFIEGYSGIHEHVSSLPRPKTIFSAIGWYFDEPFKQWAALSAENGTTLIGLQHGGNYGSDLIMYAEEHELKITDRYYSWGWQRQENAAQIIPFFATKLIGRNRIGASNARKGILLTTTAIPRYSFIIQSFMNYGVKNYLDWQPRFVSSILPLLLKNLKIRIFQPDYGWDYSHRWKAEFPEIDIEGCNTDFLKSLDNCRLFVSDHEGTTLLEAFAANKPTILFWDKESIKIRPEAEPYYNNLRAVGILHDTPESAADKVNSVYDDVEEWWNEPKLQSTVCEFSQRFCRTSENALNAWEDEFKRIIAA